MKKLLNFKSISTKILFSFSLVVLLVILLSIYNIFVLTKTKDDAIQMYDSEIPFLVTSYDLTVDVLNRTNLLRAYMIYGDESYLDEYKKSTEESKVLEDNIFTLTDSDKMYNLIDKKHEWESYVEEFIAEVNKGNRDRAREIMDQHLVILETEILKSFNEASKQGNEITMGLMKDTVISASKSITTGIIVSLTIFIASIIIAIITSRTISNPIKRLMNRTNAIADGDLSLESLTTRSRDEIGQLVNATNEMNVRMRDILSKIGKTSEIVLNHSEELTQSSNEVKVGSEQVSITMSELASGSEKQAQSVTELTMMMNNFTTKIDEADVNGKQIYNTSKNVFEMIDKGSKLMSDSTE